MAWLILIVAGLFEVGWAIGLKYTEGFTRLWPTVGTVVAIVMSMAALSDLLSQSLVQGAVHNDLRGRAMGSWLLAIGLGPVGHLQIGALAAIAGVTTALVTNGLLLVLLAALTLVGAKSIRRA